MEINISDLNIKKEIIINDNFSFPLNKHNSIKRVNNIDFIGKLYYNIANEIVLEGKMTGDIILIDAVDLSDINYKIDINIEEIIENFDKVLDINAILWENIVLEVPIRFTTKELSDLEGNGWKVLNEEDSDNAIDPRLEKLQELFKGGE